MPGEYESCTSKIFSAGVDRPYVVIFLMKELVSGQISDLSHNASGSLSNLFFGVLGDDFEEYKESRLYQAPFYFIFSLFSTT